jgi:hypothetical protein
MMVHCVVRSPFIAVVFLFLVQSLAATPRIKVIKVGVTNPTSETRLAEDVVVNHNQN